MLNAYSSLRDFESGPWTKSWKEAFPSVVENQSSAWRSPFHSSEREGANLDDFWQEICQATKRTHMLRRKHTLKLCGRGSELRLSTLTSRRTEAMKFHCSVHLGHPRRLSGDLHWKHNSKIKQRATPKWALENCESHRLHLVENPSRKSARVLRLSFACENARDERRNRQVYYEMERSSTTWRDDNLERNQFEVL